MARTRTVAGALLAVAALGGCGASTSDPGGAASCVGPYVEKPLRDRPGEGVPSPGATVAPGETLTVRGYWYTRTCNDTGGDEPLEPLPDVTLTVTLPGGRELHVGPFTPGGAQMGFAADIAVPAGTPAGLAEVADNRAAYALYTFEVASGGTG